MKQGSWRTTAMGIISCGIILLSQASAFLDSDPTTNVSWETITEALALLGIGVVARDNAVTSEQAGAKPPLPKY